MKSYNKRIVCILCVIVFLNIQFASAEDIQKTVVGDTLIFGSYEQDNNPENGPERIEWVVLEIKEDSAQLISKYGLDTQQFHQKPYREHWKRVVWEDSDIRKWLNNDFYNKAFTSEEKEQILKTVVRNGLTKYSKIEGGSDTDDYVFLLSIEEAENLFDGNKERVCFATPYATAQGAWTEYDKTCWWWLRSPGEPLEYAAHIFVNGEIHIYGNRLSGPGGSVRPSIWIRLHETD